MKMDWAERISTSLVRYLLFVFNFVFVCTGIALIWVGVLIKDVYTDYKDLLDDRYFSAPTLLITAGIIIFFVAFFGCCGALKRNHCMVFTFSVLLGAIFVMEIVAGVTGYVLSDDSEEILVASLNRTMYSYNTTNGTSVTKMWDELQTNLHCCGVNNYTEWYNVFGGRQMLPMSCCDKENGAISTFTCSGNSTSLHKAGCLTELGNEIESNAVTLGGVAFGIAFIQLIGIIFSCFLAKSIKENAYESV